MYVYGSWRTCQASCLCILGSIAGATRCSRTQVGNVDNVRITSKSIWLEPIQVRVSIYKCTWEVAYLRYVHLPVSPNSIGKCWRDQDAPQYPLSFQFSWMYVRSTWTSTGMIVRSERYFLHSWYNTWVGFETIFSALSVRLLPIISFPLIRRIRLSMQHLQFLTQSSTHEIHMPRPFSLSEHAPTGPRRAIVTTNK